MEIPTTLGACVVYIYVRACVRTSSSESDVTSSVRCDESISCPLADGHIHKPREANLEHRFTLTPKYCLLYISTCVVWTFIWPFTETIYFVCTSIVSPPDDWRPVFIATDYHLLQLSANPLDCRSGSELLGPHALYPHTLYGCMNTHVSFPAERSSPRVCVV